MKIGESHLGSQPNTLVARIDDHQLKFLQPRKESLLPSLWANQQNWPEGPTKLNLLLEKLIKLDKIICVCICSRKIIPHLWGERVIYSVFLVGLVISFL
jgi:hypothetical protein